MSTNTPLISLIIPAYNIAEYLPQSLNSAIGQTYTNLEIIVIDDGSTDSTSDIIDHYAVEDARIVPIHHVNNTGIMVVRQEGIQTATGDYVCFLDGDDYMPTDAIATLYDAIQQLHTDIVCADEIRIGKGYSIERPELWTGIIDGETFMRYQLTNYMEGYLHAKLYKRSLFADLHYPTDISLAEDKLINIQIAAKDPMVGHIPYIAYYYIKRHSSITHHTTPIEYNIRLTEYAERFLHEQGYADRFRPELTLMRLKFYWLYISHSSSANISHLPFVQDLYNRLREPAVKELMQSNFTPEERAAIRLHKRKATAWIGKLITTEARIRKSISKRLGNKSHN